MKTYEKTCAQCGKTYQARGATGKFCSRLCRSRHHNGHNAARKKRQHDNGGTQGVSLWRLREAAKLSEETGFAVKAHRRYWSLWDGCYQRGPLHRPEDVRRLAAQLGEPQEVDS